MLRAIERLRWEAQQNGNINWGELYIEFIDFLQQSFISEERFSNEVKESIMHDLNRLRNFIFPEDFKDREDAKNNGPYIDDDLYNRLIDHLIDYCRIHQIIIPLEK